MTVFLVAQALLPWTASRWWFAETIGERILGAALPALLATIGAYVLMLVAGLPVGWLLGGMGWLRPLTVVPLGAAIGVLPLVVLAIQDKSSAPNELSRLYVVGAIAGSLCALIFWAFSGRRQRQPTAAR